MDLLFKREQTSGKVMRINFKLWGMIELDESEQALVTRYRFDQAVLIAVVEPDLAKRAALVGFVAFIGAGLLLMTAFGIRGLFIAPIVGAVVGYWWFNEKRETIFVRDLLHGRHFKCDSVIELAKKEAWLTDLVSFLRQVMESAKHWDGAERHHIEALPRDEARQFILRG